MYTRLLNIADNHYWKYYNWTNTTSVISECGIFSRFLSLFSVLPINVIVSGVKSSR